MNSECVFCNIISGTTASRIVYRDDDIIAFLPHVLNTRGHTLIVPVKHFVDLYDLPDLLASSIMSVARVLGNHYRLVLGASGLNLMHASGATAQRSVAHFHMHLLPRFEGDGLNAWPDLPAWQGNLDDLHSLIRIDTTNHG